MAKRKVHYTFGNHMHWVDMQWLWGYDVLPGSVRDMLQLIEAAGIKGCVNFDVIGYEKLASECPEGFEKLKQAIVSGSIEIVGGSYGQPYGHLHGGESNIRQRIYGVRACERLFGIRPLTFWEEEFDFFGQLPQILKQCGFTGASLFFQWTWHTPEVPFESDPVILWTAPDGSFLPAATRNGLNLHQWPEDFDPMLTTLAEGSKGGELILQWLELMPSPDWMCRSELLLPRLKALLSDERFEIAPCTLSEFLSLPREKVCSRQFAPHEAWHGLTLGKNGDRMRRLSRQAESQLLGAEALASVVSLFGRPYAQWDVYPAWTLDEAWRELLAAQHHDNDECEGLCGAIGRVSYEKSLSLSKIVLEENLALLSQRVDAPAGSLVVYNPLGWAQGDTFFHPVSGEAVVVRDIPAFGWKCFSDTEKKTAPWVVVGLRADAVLGELRISVDLNETSFQVRKSDDEVLLGWLPRLVQTEIKGRVELVPTGVRVDPVSHDLVIAFAHPAQGHAEMWIKCVAEVNAVDISVKAFGLPRPDPGFGGALMLDWPLLFHELALIDSPYAVEEQRVGSTGVRKYPEGDWMTSPQWFEDIRDAFTCLSMIDFGNALVCHDGSMQWFCNSSSVRCVLNAYDPWDEGRWESDFVACFRLIPHGEVCKEWLWQRAMEFLNPPVVALVGESSRDIPSSFSAVTVHGVSATALFREASDFCGMGFERYAGHEIATPFVLRLVEMNGKDETAQVVVQGALARAFRTNLLGEIEEELEILDGCRITVKMWAHEFATVVLDIVEGRKQSRDLDTKREVWATVHRRNAE